MFSSYAFENVICITTIVFVIAHCIRHVFSNCLCQTGCFVWTEPRNIGKVRIDLQYGPTQTDVDSSLPIEDKKKFTYIPNSAKANKAGTCHNLCPAGDIQYWRNCYAAAIV